DVCVTLSLGERTKESYQKLYNAGAERYLLRHETANEEHYKKLHPENMSYDNRIRCLYDLKEIGYQTGCGFMVESPYQTAENLVEDLRFIKNFNPEMCGIGPFIPHKSTPFKDFQSGNLDLTIKMLALVRLLIPDVLLPATTALATISKNGRELGLKAGTNVIMPNLLPMSVAKKYSLYDNKFHEENDIEKLKQELEKMGYQLAISRGDNIRMEMKNV
ncbi:MAG: [FeFe] hydrogenase H-cluster radical SAM maturase HydE, partial [bacterium]|nr:[FeFe] hydrogenase H-cluster radical SAM maturase HydE [bacterium]